MASRKTTSKATVLVDDSIPHVQHQDLLVHDVRHGKVLIDADLAQL